MLLRIIGFLSFGELSAVATELCSLADPFVDNDGRDLDGSRIAVGGPDRKSLPLNCRDEEDLDGDLE